MSTNEIEWIGDFTDEEIEEIGRLRERQVESIKNSDAESYRNLCAEDVTLMLTGYSIVRGRNNFYELERKFLGGIEVKVMEQSPVFINKLDDVVIEVGNQKFETFANSLSPKGFKATRKYMHVMQRTSDGWKFLILMSNDSE